MDDALQRRLDRIERRLSLVLALLVGGYALGIAWLLIEETAAVTPWHVGFGAVIVAVLALIAGIYRRRQSTRETL